MTHNGYRTMRSITIASRFAAALTLLCSVAVSHAASRDEQTKACKGDAIHFCSSEIPNKEKITACMKAHYQELSPGCKTMFRKPGPGAAKSGAQSQD
jgi:hypothetical protein